MLVLSRKQGEGILIGKDIRIVVKETRTGKVRIGIEAPLKTVIVREELVNDLDDEVKIDTL